MKIKILAIGNSNLNNCQSNNQGFTLLEILIVIIIISIMTVLGVQFLNSGSVERQLQQTARNLQASLEFACDQATLENIYYGLTINEQGYNFSKYMNSRWLEISNNENLPVISFDETFSLRVEIGQQEVNLSEGFSSNNPQIRCSTNGELSEFKLVFSDSSNSHHYQIKNKGFWDTEGQWLAQ